MTSADWIVLILYLVGTVSVGVYLGRLVKNSSDLFTAGGKSPWWLSGLSAFMTMFSATASMISSQLNVFSSVLTKNIYEPLANSQSDAQLLRVGRICTVILGILIALIAIATPYLGGAAALIISVTQIMVTPLLAPTLASLFFRKIGTSSIWITVGICFPLGLLTQFTDLLRATPFQNSTVTGVILPLFIVGGCILFGRKNAPEWSYPIEVDSPEVTVRSDSSRLPARILAPPTGLLCQGQPLTTSHG